MDLIKIGNYLSELRRAKGLTQEELGEILGVTNKTVSRWETGTYIPPAEALLKLSELYSVSINEILSGRTLSDTEYKEAAEKNLKETIEHGNFDVAEKLQYFKRKWYREHLFYMILAAIAVIAVYVAGFIFKRQELGYAAAIMVIGFCGHFNDQKMAYVEGHVYCDKKK